MEELIQRITEEVAVHLKQTDESKDMIRRYVNRAVNHVLIFCNREDIPPLLEDVITQIAEDMLKADRVVETPQAISSVTRGDTSISYRDGLLAHMNAVAFMKNYDLQLTRFKKMKLPKG